MTKHPFKCIVYQASYKKEECLLWCERNLNSNDYWVDISLPYMTKHNWVILCSVYTFKYESDLLAFRLVHDLHNLTELHELHK